MAEPQATLASLLLRTYRLLEDVPFLDPITANIAATPASGSITITVNDPTNWPTGSRFEVDDEIFLVTAGGTNPITVQRAYESTLAAAHTSTTLGRKDPRFLHATVKEAINVALGNWCSHFFPQLVWDTTTAGTFTPNTWIYTAPADALSIRRVTWQVPGFTRYIDVNASNLMTFPTSVCSTGLGFEIYDYMGLPGRAVNVLYEKRWPFLTLDTDVVPTDFPQDADDLLPLGAILYIAGARQVPKWRLDEITFYREQSSPMPSQFNMAWLKNGVMEWYQRATEVRSRRPIGSASAKIYRGVVG